MSSKMRIGLLSVLLLIQSLILSGLFLGVTASAAEPLNCEDEKTKSILGIPTWYKYLESEEVAGKCSPRINIAEDALPIGLAVLEIMLTLSGVVAVVMVIWGSFQFVLTQGEPDKAASARKTVINAAIGLVIVIIAARVVSFIATSLTS